MGPGPPLGLPWQHLPRPQYQPCLPALLALLLALFLQYTDGLPLSSTSEEDRRAACDVGACWNLFERARESLGVRSDYPPPPDYTPPPGEDPRTRCVPIRTFYLCIQNMTQVCHGDLNFHSAKLVVDQHLRQFNCSARGPIFTHSASSPTRRPSSPSRLPVCSYRGPSPRALCLLYGDPHLRTFGGVHQTCRVAGAWSLLDNEFLTLQVTSEPVMGSIATALTKVTLIIKGHDECALEDYVTYQAPDPSGVLPAAFDDGRQHFGPQKSVRIDEHASGTHVEVHLRYIDTRIVLRRWGVHLSLALSTPLALVNASTSPSVQLCQGGCPTGQQLHLSELLADQYTQRRHAYTASPATPAPQGQVALPPRSLHPMSREAAQERCHIAGVVDAYLDNCVFDLISTGELNFTRMAAMALQDALRLLPEEAAQLQNRTHLPEAPSAASSCPRMYYLLRTPSALWVWTLLLLWAGPLKWAMPDSVVL